MYKAGSLDSPPNSFCYTAVINACAYAEDETLEKRDSLKIFVETYKEFFNSDVKPNHVTFSASLTAIRRLLPPGQQQYATVKTIFKSCTETGFLDQQVLKGLISVLPKDALKDLLGAETFKDGKVDYALLPEKWKQNVPGTQRN